MKRWEACFNVTPYQVTNISMFDKFTDPRVIPSGHKIALKNHPDMHYWRVYAETIMMAEFRSLEIQKLIEIAPGSGYARRIAQLKMWQQKFIQDEDWKETPPPMDYYVVQPNLNPYDHKYLKSKSKVKPLTEAHFTATILPSRILSECTNLPGGYYYLGNVVYYMRKADWLALWGKEDERATKRVAGAFAYAMDPLSDEGEAFGMKWYKTPNKKQTIFKMDDGAMWGHPTDWYNRLTTRPSIAWQIVVKDPHTGCEVMHTLYYFDAFFALSDFRDYDEDPMGFINPSYTLDSQVSDLFGVDASSTEMPPTATGSSTPVTVIAPKPEKPLNVAVAPPPKIDPKGDKGKEQETPAIEKVPQKASVAFELEIANGNTYVKPILDKKPYRISEVLQSGEEITYEVNSKHHGQINQLFSKVPSGYRPEAWAEAVAWERARSAETIARLDALEAHEKFAKNQFSQKRPNPPAPKSPELLPSSSSDTEDEVQAPRKPPRRKCDCARIGDAIAKLDLSILELRGRTRREVDNLQEDHHSVAKQIEKLQATVDALSVQHAISISTPAPTPTPTPPPPSGTSIVTTVMSVVNSALPAVTVYNSIQDGMARKWKDVTAPYKNLSSYIYPTEQSADDLMKSLFPIPEDLENAERMSNLFPIGASGDDKDQYVRSFARDRGLSFPKAADIAHKIEPAIKLAHARLRGDTDWVLIRTLFLTAVFVSLFTVLPMMAAAYSQHHLIWRFIRDAMELVVAFASNSHMLGFVFLQLTLFIHGYNKTALTLGACFMAVTMGAHQASWLSYGPEVDLFSKLHNAYMRGGFAYAYHWMDAYPALKHLNHHLMNAYHLIVVQNELLGLMFLHCLNPLVWIKAYAENCITVTVGPLFNIIMDTIVWGKFSMAATGVHMIVWKSNDPIFSTMLHVFYNAVMYHEYGQIYFIWLVGIQQWLLNFKITRSEKISKYLVFALIAAFGAVALCAFIPDSRTTTPRVLCHTDIVDSACWSENALPVYDNSYVDWCNHILYNNTLCNLFVMPTVTSGHWQTNNPHFYPADFSWFGSHPASWISTPVATLLVVWWNRSRAEPMVTPIYDHFHPSPKRGLTIAPVCAGLKTQTIRPGAKAEPPVGKCNHTSPGYTLMGPRLSCATVYCFKGCTCNAWQAMGGRMGGVPKRYKDNPDQVNDDRDEVTRNVEALWERMKKKMMHGSYGGPIVRYKPTQLTRQQWSKRYTAKQAKRMHERWLISDGSDCYSAFVKAEKSMLHSKSPPDLLNPLNWGVTPWGATANSPSLSDPRGISVPHVSKRYKLGPEADKFNKTLMHKFRGQIFYACGSTPEDIGRWTRWVMDNHTWGLSVMGDDVLHLYKRDGVWYVESLDISRYDMHIRQAHIMITTYVMASLGLHALANDLRRMSLNRQYIVSGPDQVGTLKVKGTRASGDPDTISSNSFITMLVAWDGKERGVGLDQAFWDAGFIVTKEEDTFESGKWDYLQKLFYPAATPEGYRPAPKIGRFISRAFWSRTPYTPKNRPGYCRGVALSLEKDFNHVPIARKLIHRILELTEGAVPKYDVDFKRALEYGHFSRERAGIDDSVYEFIQNRYGLSRSDVEAMEERIGLMQWDEFIDDEHTKHLFSKLLVDL